MLFGTFIRILTSLIRDFCTSDRNFASTFFQIPSHDGHPWSWLVVGHCDNNPHNRLSLSRYMPCPAYQKMNKAIPCSSLSLDRSIQSHHPYQSYPFSFVDQNPLVKIDYKVRLHLKSACLLHIQFHAVRIGF